MNKQASKLDQTKIWMLLVILAGFAARLYQLDAKSLWFDEIVRVELARLPWHDGLIGLLGQGIQLTPLFHGIIKLWLFVGETDWFLRAPAVWVGVLTVPLIFKAGQYFLGNGAGLLAAFIFAVNPFQVWFGQEAALYNLLTFAAIGSMLAFGHMVRSNGKRGWGAMIFFNAIGFPAHYFMFLISATQFLYLALTLRRTRQTLRYWFVAQLVAVLVLVPWWLFIINQHHFAVGIGWVPQPRWFDPLLTVWDFSYGYSGRQPSPIIMGSLIVLALGLVLGVWQSWKRSGWGLLLSLWLVFPPAITFIMSFRYLSFYVDRYLLVISPVVTLLTVYGLLGIPVKWLRWGLLAVFMGSTLWGLEQIYFDPVQYNKDDWRLLARTVNTLAEPDDVVITCTDGYKLAFEHYNPHQTLSPNNVKFAAQIDQGWEPGTQTVWVVNLHYRPPVHNMAAALPPILDHNRLSAEAARWERENLRDKISVAGISMYKYNVTNPLFLPEIIGWHCQSFKVSREQIYAP